MPRVKRDRCPLKIARAKKGLSQRAAADLIGISYVHLCNVENRKSDISMDLARKLAKFYGVTLDYLFG